MEVINITTNHREEMIPLSRQIDDLVMKKRWENGAVLVFSPHTTASVTINESADPDVRRDIIRFMRQAVPQNAGFAHAEGNSDSHIKTSLFSPHCLLIVKNGKIMRGTWQEVYLCEWDGPRRRLVWVQFLST